MTRGPLLPKSNEPPVGLTGENAGSHCITPMYWLIRKVLQKVYPCKKLRHLLSPSKKQLHPTVGDIKPLTHLLPGLVQTNPAEKHRGASRLGLHLPPDGEIMKPLWNQSRAVNFYDAESTLTRASGRIICTQNIDTAAQYIHGFGLGEMTLMTLSSKQGI